MCTSKESSPYTPYVTPVELHRFSDIDFASMDKDGCYAFIEMFTGEKLIAYECGVILPMYVEHFGNSNNQEWLDKHKDKVVGNIEEEVLVGSG
ncbi:unnamed protein product [Lactuca saligna]|uniref:Uncharacterized protein n=1 Tax=Lactuca saligna TaxID=75948 RepID=A0AA35ZY21_LACSI|nr:unnamed protein product [Lactuca saligna]